MIDSGSTFQEEFFQKHDYYKIITLLLQKGEPVEMPLYGHCMRPFIRNGDTVLIKPEKLRCGDIAVYKSGNRFKIHRFLEIQNIYDKDHLITRGDRCINRDPPVPAANFLGIISKVTRNDRVMDYRTGQWKVANLLLGKLSPSISLIERPVRFLLRPPKRCAEKLYRIISSPPA